MPRFLGNTLGVRNREWLKSWSFIFGRPNAYGHPSLYLISFVLFISIAGQREWSMTYIERDKQRPAGTSWDKDGIKAGMAGVLSLGIRNIALKIILPIQKHIKHLLCTKYHGLLSTYHHSLQEVDNFMGESDINISNSMRKRLLRSLRWQEAVGSRKENWGTSTYSMTVILVISFNSQDSMNYCHMTESFNFLHYYPQSMNEEKEAFQSQVSC